MNDKKPSEETSWLDDFIGGFKEEFGKEQKNDLSADEIEKGLVSGTTETIFHPFRWLRSIINK